MGVRALERMLARFLPVLVGLTVVIYLCKSYVGLPTIAKDGDMKIHFNVPVPDANLIKFSQEKAQQYLFPPWHSHRPTKHHADQKDAILLAKLARIAPIPTPPYAMVMCTRIWNEARYLDEWITYHYLLGFDHFMLDDHGSTDNTMEILQSYIDAGLVTLTHTAANTTIVDSERAAREHCYDGSVIPNKDMRWVGQIDLDEHLVLSQARVPITSFRPTAAQELFNDYERRQEAVVQITRLHLGTNNHVLPPQWPMGQGDAYTERRFLEGPGNFWPKVMCRAGKWRPVPQGEHATQHCALGIDGWKRATASHQLIPERDASKISEWDYINTFPPVFDPVHIVHFQTRSLDECLSKNRHPKTSGSWRAIAGEDVTCNSWHPSHPAYQPHLHTEHLVLKNSVYNRATRYLLKTGGLFAE